LTISCKNWQSCFLFFSINPFGFTSWAGKITGEKMNSVTEVPGRLADDPADCIELYNGEDRRLMQLAEAAKKKGADRVEELVRFARAGGLRRIGIAHCVALADAAKNLERRLQGEFEIMRVDCKLCRIPAEALIEGGRGTACNPVGQARVLAAAKTELNIVLGLCVGHDLLFTKHSAAPCTTLVVKDRVHQHNPMAALK
jgi:uncharacterized metal-binding protein